MAFSDTFLLTFTGGDMEIVVNVVAVAIFIALVGVALYYSSDSFKNWVDRKRGK